MKEADMTVDPRDGSTAAAENAERLQLNPYPPASSYLDGSWWPRSPQLADELPGLVSTLSSRLGQVIMVGYHVNAWIDTPAQTQIDGHTIQLQGFTADKPASVIVIGRDGRRVTLLVIPPDASEQTVRKEQQTTSKQAISASHADTQAERSTAKSISEVAGNLARHEGRDDQERTADIARWCDEAAEQFSDSKVQSFVPILVEHIVRNRMDAPSLAS